MPLPMSRYYFAYGSDLDAGQMTRRCPGAQARGKAFLPAHTLRFSHPSPTWGGGSEDVVSDILGLGVWGYVYEMTVADWIRLDEAQGEGYRRIRMTVWENGVEDCPLEVQLYRVINPTGPHLPAKSYHEKLVRGAQARGLPAGWVTWLRGLPTK